MLELANVSAGYRHGGAILRDVSCTVESQQTLAVYGLNGSGKSTLLKVCAGLLIPQQGEVRSSFGRPGYLQQNPRLQLLASTAHEELALSLRSLYSGEELDCAITEWLARFGLTEIGERNPRDLSGGQQQQVALAAILCRRPSLLLLDEPHAFLDGRSAREFRSFVNQHCAECAVIWTHSRRASAPKASRFLELRDGKLTEQSAPHVR